MSESVDTAKAAAKLEAIEAINREPSFTAEVKSALIEAYLQEDISVEGAQSTQLSFIVGSKAAAPREDRNESDISTKRDLIAAIYQDNTLSPKEKHLQVQALVGPDQPNFVQNGTANARGRAVQAIYKDDTLSPREKLERVHVLMEANAAPARNTTSRLASALARRRRPRPAVEIVSVSPDHISSSVTGDSVSQLEQDSYFKDEFSKGSRSHPSDDGTRTYGRSEASTKQSNSLVVDTDTLSDISDGQDNNKRLYVMLFCAVVFFWAIVGPLLGSYWDDITGNGDKGTVFEISTLSPTAFTTQEPTAMVHFPPSTNQCLRISQGNSVFGQEEMAIKSFRLDVDVTLNLATSDASSLMDTVAEAMQRILAPTLAGCPKNLLVSAQGVRGRDRRRLIKDYVVGSAKVEAVPGSDNGNCAQNYNACFRMKVALELYMKGYESNLRVINHINGIFGRKDLFNVLELSAPFEDVEVINVLATAETTDVPTSEPSLPPTGKPTGAVTLTPTRSPTLSPTGNTRIPTRWPTNRPTPAPQTPPPTMSRRSHIEQSLRNIPLTNVDAYDWLFNADYWVPSTLTASTDAGVWIDRYVLMTLYYTSQGPTWGIRNGWGASINHCSWVGVSCHSSNNRVSGVELRGNLMIGSFPRELMALTKLTALDLSQNTFAGSLPTEIGLMTDLRTLNLNSMGLTGSIPDRIGNLSNLRLLDMSNNAMEATIPTQVARMTSLRSFLMPNNLLFGELPTQFRQCSNMEYFDLSNNQMSGSIPRRIMAMTNLVFLGLANNNFQNNIPSEVVDLTKLQILRLDGNELSGFIPALPLGLVDCTLAGNSFSEDIYSLLRGCRVE
ncbi:unnamed protein product [Cylindrotheca closterium]|uniref:Leucine-rich repeat-containing N-terminal plant-type domain-containing protein n=1 Tax=Cylindrotheca closterium TaxID=2856 RepID=A0AAD2CG58_9STRA|nr:unnamed protein product [Cylindrotheca closterium]